jgi:hypothetical protein
VCFPATLQNSVSDLHRCDHSLLTPSPHSGSSGFVVINNSDGSWSSSFTTSLPDGTYCDVYTGPKSGSSCSGASYTVSGGIFTATVAARSALALHTGATGGTGSSSNVTITFSVYATTTWGQNIYVAGNVTQLGNWTPSSGVRNITLPFIPSINILD